MGDGADERADPAIVAAKLENFFHHGPVLALEIARLARRRHDVRTFVDLHAKDAVRVGVGRAGNAAVKGHQRDDAAPASASATSATTPTLA